MIESPIPTRARDVLRELDVFLGVTAAVPLLSALRSPAYPPSLRLALVAMWAVALWRPADALIVLALFVSFGSAALTWLDLPPLRLTEAMVLATLSGAWIASIHQRRAALRHAERGASLTGAWPVATFAVVVVASLAVVLGVREIGVRSPWLELRNLGLFLTHDYLVGPAPEFAGLTDAALLLEGVGLMWVVRRHARGRATLVLSAVAAAAVASSALAFVQATGADASGQGMIAGLLHARASGPVSDVNAIGSLFAMCACLTLGVALDRRGGAAVRAAATGVTMALLGGVWLSGSRMALVAAIGGATLLGAHARLKSARQRRWAIGLLALAAAIVLIAVTVGLDPRPSDSRTASNSFSRRADFMITGLRMIGSAPAFGVGIGRYFEMSGSFMPESIYWFYFHENAHNNFLQIAGELGLVGLAAFLWLLISSATHLVRAVRSRGDDALLAAAAVGAAAFVATWLTSHPLLVAEVAYTFWIVLGAALARADDNAQLSVTERPASRRWTTAAALTVLAVCVSIPLRIRAASPAQPFDRLAFGFYDWENDNGFPYRWTSRRATFFVPAGARELHLPIRSMMILGHLDPVTFSVAVDGRVLDTFRITQGNWQTVDLRLPPASDNRAGFARIDVMTDPAWTPAATGANHDVRVLGVQLGRPDAR